MKEKKERILEEQKAPLKNTDHAFVQVNKDGSPELPRTSKNPKEAERDQKGPINRP